MRKKRVENYPDSENFAEVIHYGLHGFIVKNIQDESTEANDLCGSRSVALMIPC